MARHFIRGLAFDLGFKAQRAAGRDSEDLARSLVDALLPEIEAAFDEALDRVGPLILDRLEIDLGTIAADGPSAADKERLRHRLLEALIAGAALHPNWPSPQTDASAGRAGLPVPAVHASGSGDAAPTTDPMSAGDDAAAIVDRGAEILDELTRGRSAVELARTLARLLATTAGASADLIVSVAAARASELDDARAFYTDLIGDVLAGRPLDLDRAAAASDSGDDGLQAAPRSGHEPQREPAIEATLAWLLALIGEARATAASPRALDSGASEPGALGAADREASGAGAVARTAEPASPDDALTGVSGASATSDHSAGPLAPGADAAQANAGETAPVATEPDGADRDVVAARGMDGDPLLAPAIGWLVQRIADAATELAGMPILDLGEQLRRRAALSGDPERFLQGVLGRLEAGNMDRAVADGFAGAAVSGLTPADGTSGPPTDNVASPDVGHTAAASAPIPTASEDADERAGDSIAVEGYAHLQALFRGDVPAAEIDAAIAALSPSMRQRWTQRVSGEPLQAAAWSLIGAVDPRFAALGLPPPVVDAAAARRRLLDALAATDDDAALNLAFGVLAAYAPEALRRLMAGAREPKFASRGVARLLDDAASIRLLRALDRNDAIARAMSYDRRLYAAGAPEAFSAPQPGPGDVDAADAQATRAEFWQDLVQRALVEPLDGTLLSGIAPIGETSSPAPVELARPGKPDSPAVPEFGEASAQADGISPEPPDERTSLPLDPAGQAAPSPVETLYAAYEALFDGRLPPGRLEEVLVRWRVAAPQLLALLRADLRLRPQRLAIVIHGRSAAEHLALLRAMVPGGQELLAAVEARAGALPEPAGFVANLLADVVADRALDLEADGTQVQASLPVLPPALMAYLRRGDVEPTAAAADMNSNGDLAALAVAAVRLTPADLAEALRRLPANAARRLAALLGEADRALLVQALQPKAASHLFFAFERLALAAGPQGAEAFWRTLVERSVRPGLRSPLSAFVGDAVRFLAYASSRPVALTIGDLEREAGAVDLATEAPAAQAFRAALAQALEPPPSIPQQVATTGAVWVDDAGAVLMGVYLPRLFDRFELLEEGVFKDARAKRVALGLVHHAVWGDDPVHVLALPGHVSARLCGVAETEEPLFEITDRPAQEAIEGLLQAMIANWSAVGKTSVAGLRQSFLQRPGVLRQNDKGFDLRVEGRAYDMLLDRLPWTYGLIKHRWMEAPIMVEWR